MHLCKKQESKHNFKLGGSLTCKKDLVSVIIPVCGEDISLLPECLKYIYGQDYAKLEVIIVNNGIDKQKLELSLSSFTDKNKNLRFVHIEKNMGASYGRNEGAFCSRGEYLWFVDSDVCRIDSAVASFSVQVLKERADIGAIGGQCSEIDDAVYLFLGRRSDKNFKENRKKYVLFEDEYVNTCNLLMRKRDFVEINGFTDFIEYIQDDLDLGFKIRKLGLKCVVDYRAVAYHPFSYKGWDDSQLWMFYKNSILFYSINYSGGELIEFLTKKYLSKNLTDKGNGNETKNNSSITQKLHNLGIFLSACSLLSFHIVSIIGQRCRRQKLLNRLEKRELKNVQ